MNKLDVVLVGLGVCFICDALISIRLYLNTKDETGKRTQSWKYDHSIRILRGLGGLALIILGVCI